MWLIWSKWRGGELSHAQCHPPPALSFPAVVDRPSAALRGVTQASVPLTSSRLALDTQPPVVAKPTSLLSELPSVRYSTIATSQLKRISKQCLLRAGLLWQLYSTRMVDAPFLCFTEA